MPPILTSELLRLHHDRLGELVALLPDLGLSTEAKGALSGYLFREGPELVRLVDGAEGAPGLQARIQRATVLRLIERLLGEAARRAGELALCDQAGAVEDALSIVASARAGADQPGGRVRLDRLRPALRLLDQREARAQKGRARARSRRRGAEDPLAEETTQALAGKRPALSIPSNHEGARR